MSTIVKSTRDLLQGIALHEGGKIMQSGLIGVARDIPLRLYQIGEDNS
jgi:hypothetical protein